MQILDQLMASVAQAGQQDNPDPADLDLRLYSPCPVKLAAKERPDAVLAEYARIRACLRRGGAAGETRPCRPPKEKAREDF